MESIQFISILFNFGLERVLWSVAMTQNMQILVEHLPPDRGEQAVRSHSLVFQEDLLGVAVPEQRIY